MGFVECRQPVATTTQAGLPGWGPRSAWCGSDVI